MRKRRNRLQGPLFFGSLRFGNYENREKHVFFRSGNVSSSFTDNALTGGVFRVALRRGKPWKQTILATRHTNTRTLFMRNKGVDHPREDAEKFFALRPDDKQLELWD